METRRASRVFIAAVAGCLGGAAWADPPPPQPLPDRMIALEGIPIDLQKPKQEPPKVNVSPEATGTDRFSPAGNEHGTSTPQSNKTGSVVNPPESPTPPGFPFGPPGGNLNPAGPPASGPQVNMNQLPP